MKHRSGSPRLYARATLKRCAVKCKRQRTMVCPKICLRRRRPRCEWWRNSISTTRELAVIRNEFGLTQNYSLMRWASTRSSEKNSAGAHCCMTWGNSPSPRRFSIRLVGQPMKSGPSFRATLRQVFVSLRRLLSGLAMPFTPPGSITNDGTERGIPTRLLARTSP